jgi:hypothetical protein
VVVFESFLAEILVWKAGAPTHPAIMPELFSKNSDVDSLRTQGSPVPPVLVRGFQKESITSLNGKNMSCYAQF